MLVLSRRPGEKFLFPSLGVSVEVLRSRGTLVRLGIQAPDEIPILRGELSVDEGPPVTQELGKSEREASSAAIARQQRHELRNRVNLLTLKLELLRRQLEAGQVDQPELTLSDAISDLSELEQSIGDHGITPENVKGRRILIVEDQAAERELLASCLRLSGLDVVTVSDGAAALEYLRTHEPPELVLLDMRMPGVDGPTLLDAVRADARLQNLRVFAVSGSPKAEFPNTALAVDGWFSKPVRMDALLHAVNLPASGIETKA